MAQAPTAADQFVLAAFDKVKEKSHKDRLEEATIAVAFVDQKPFNKGRLNWGKVRRFQQIDKLWHPDSKQYDFLITIPTDLWFSVLSTSDQHEALADLLLTRCAVEYEPVTEEETVKGVVKKKVVKDDWGRVEYTNEIKRDKETGEPKWRVLPLDLYVFSENASRYGLWCSVLMEFKESIKEPV